MPINRRKVQTYKWKKRANFMDFFFLEFSYCAYNFNFSQNLGTNTPWHANARSSCERLVTISDLKTEERKQKLSRYQKKKIN
jgi:hypothetical protein